MYEPENWPNPNFGEFKDAGTTFDTIDTFDSNTGRLYTCDIGTDTGTADFGAF
jgi:hypothetical protein